MDEMESLLSELSSVVMTKTTKGGLTESQILKEYQDLCGKRVEFAKHGYRTLGDLLRSNPQKFYCQGNFWFGRITEENEDIIRSMASEKSKKGRDLGATRGRFPMQGRPTRFLVGSSQGFAPRAGPQLFGRKDSPHYHQRSSESPIPRFGPSQSNNDRSSNNASPSVISEGAWKSNQRVPAKTGFGNKSFNYIPSGSSTRSSSPSRDDDYDIEAPPGLSDPLNNSIASEKCSESRLESFHGMVAKEVAAPEYPPGLPIDGASDEPPAPSVFNRADTSGLRELSEEQRTRLDIAQKTYDLLKQTGTNLSVKEIADRLADRLPEDSGGMTARAQVGMAVKNHSETFSLSSMNSDGVVSINPGAPRPTTNTVVGAPRDQKTDRALPRNLQRPQEREEDLDLRITRRENKENMLERNENRGYDRTERAESPWKRIEDGSDDDSWGGGVSADTGQFKGNSRFSVPISTKEPRRQPVETYPLPRREDRFARSSSPPPKHSSVYYSSYDDLEDRDRSDFKRRDDFCPSRFEEGDDCIMYDTWKSIRRDHSSHFEEPPRAANAGGYDDYRDGYTISRRRFIIPLEPKKFECRHRYLMNEPVPRYESVILTHFVALDEFYLRSLNKEKEYQNMLNELRDDYKGSLDDASPQLWMKGDGAAVRYEHRWQRGVVRRIIPNAGEKYVEIFLVDVGKTVTVSSEQMVPLHNRYHSPPYAICCSIGFFDIIPGQRRRFLDECEYVAKRLSDAMDNELEMRSLERFWDETEKLKVQLSFHDSSYATPKDIVFPRYFEDQDLIKLRN